MDERLRDFVRIDGRVGLIVRNDRCGGVLRGHADVWFGELLDGGSPRVMQIMVGEDWELIESPLGQLRGTL